MNAARLTLLIGWALASTAPAASERDAAWERLLTERDSPEAFAATIAGAREAGISDQGILEARFLFHVDRGEDDRIAALAPEFIKRRDAFKTTDSEIFATVEDWLAVVEYTQALAALRNDDHDAFKKHITEAFWLSPQQGAAFAPHIERLRLKEAMKDLRVDPATKLARLHGGEVLPFSQIIEGKTATLLHFWSPWSRECDATMPDFIATAIELEKHNIAVISILPEQAPEVVKDALEIIAPLGAKPPGAWLIDRPREPLAGMLRIGNLPGMVLLDHDGAVLFNGHPADADLWTELRKAAPAMVRPAPQSGAPAEQ